MLLSSYFLLVRTINDVKRNVKYSRSGRCKQDEHTENFSLIKIAFFRKYLNLSLNKPKGILRYIANEILQPLHTRKNVATCHK